jgi:NAD(P)-dependent dehydrogenase (short-subunit alcohol dehydrogenase family)
MEAAGKLALVTGASRGLGLETATELAELGFDVLLTSRAESGRTQAEALAARGLAVQHRSARREGPAEHRRARRRAHSAPAEGSTCS